MFTPAIRATNFSPVADPSRERAFYVLLSRAGVRKREHDALPLDLLGPGIVIKLSDLDAPLINGFNPLSSTAGEPRKPEIRLNSQGAREISYQAQNAAQAFDFDALFVENHCRRRREDAAETRSARQLRLKSAIGLG